MSTEIEECKINEDSKVEIISILTCPLCRGIFRDPQTICECLHTFCEACLIKYFQKVSPNENYACPKCHTDIGTNSSYKNRIKDNKIFSNLINIMFPELAELNEKNKIHLYKSFHDMKLPLPDEKDVLLNEDGKISIELKPLRNQVVSEKKLPSFYQNLVKVKGDCDTDSIKKYIKNQLLKKNCQLQTYKEIMLNYKGIDLEKVRTVKEVMQLFQITGYSLELTYYKK